MNRKLLILNIALGIGVIYAGVELRSVWMAAKARQAKMPGPAPKAPFVAPVAPLPRQPAVLPSGYTKVAQNDLFDASRNPDIPVPPPPAPPPPENPPPLPTYHGMMNFGDAQGPVALITEGDTPGHEEKHAGETIGAFKLMAFDRQEMTLDWKGRTIHARLNQSGDDRRKAAAPAPAVGTAPLPLNGVIPGQEPAQQEPTKMQGELGPGAAMTDSVRACQAGDSSAPGAVSDGFRKEINNSPMGPQCLWRAVGK